LLSLGAETLPPGLEQLSRDRIIEALRRHAGNLTRAARHLGVSTVGPRKMMKRMGINK